MSRRASALAIGVTPLLVADWAEVPAAFVAVAVNEYVVPLVRPETVQAGVADSHDAPPGLAATW